MAERADVGYKPVTCTDCGRSYTCTPLDDYYNFTTSEDGVCYRCLLAQNNLQPASHIVVFEPDLGAHSQHSGESR